MSVNLENRVLTTTQDKILPSAVDAVLRENVFATSMLGKAKAWNGEQVKRPVKVSKNSTGTSFAGFDTFSTSATDNRQLLAYHPKFYQITVALPLDELAVNSTPERVLDLAAIEIEGAAQDCADDVGDLFWGDGTGNGSKDFLGLAAHVDDGNSVATIGGLSRSTYTVLQSTVTASGGAVSLANMATLYHAISDGSQTPDVGYCNRTVWGLIEQLFTPQERIVKGVSDLRGGISVGGGPLAIWFKGFPILADRKATAQNLYFLNSKFLDWHGLKLPFSEPVKFKNQIEGNDYSNVMGLGFSWGGWIKPSNSATVVGHLYLAGELVGWNPRRHGRLTGITSV